MPMVAARGPRRDPDKDRLLVVDPDSGAVNETAFARLPELLDAGDLVVVNDAGTRPSSLALRTSPARGAIAVEARLLDQGDDGSYGAVLFGTGTWRDDTDLRPAPAAVAVGDVLWSAHGSARVISVSALSPRLVRLALDDAMSAALFLDATPVQYSYMDDALRLADVQTPYASRPWAAEMPSAGRALSVSLLVSLRRRGVAIARVTAAAGLSATGDPALDALLPLPEVYEIPSETVDAVARAHRRGARVIAVGTSTVRALESAVEARDDERKYERGGDVVVRAGRGVASLVIRPGFVRRVVDGILSGMHEAGTSHDSLLRAFAPAHVVDAAIEMGRRRGLLVHELGDHCLIVPPSVHEDAARTMHIRS